MFVNRTRSRLALAWAFASATFFATATQAQDPELMRVNKSPVGGIITQYSAGLTTWAPLVQWMVNF
jgi:hypothetical protein